MMLEEVYMYHHTMLLIKNGCLDFRDNIRKYVADGEYR